jgi:hypothetical protein
VLEFDDTELQPFAADGLTVPLIRMTSSVLPSVEIKVSDQLYRYDRSYPYKGQSAVLPGFLREQVASGKKPLLIERPDRLYVYFAA